MVLIYGLSSLITIHNTAFDILTTMDTTANTNAMCKVAESQEAQEATKHTIRDSRRQTTESHDCLSRKTMRRMIIKVIGLGKGILLKLGMHETTKQRGGSENLTATRPITIHSSDNNNSNDSAIVSDHSVDEAVLVDIKIPFLT